MKSVTEPNGSPPIGLLPQAGIAALVGIALAVTGAFGTDSLPLAVRFLYWIGGLIMAGIVVRLIALPMREVCTLVGIDTDWSYLLAVPLLGAVLVTLLGVAGIRISDDSMALYGQTVGIGIGLFLLFGALHWIGAKRKQSRDRGNVCFARYQPLVGTSLHERLRTGFGPILALGVEDHYVSVVGKDCKELVLISLTRAIGEAGSPLGIRVHRSWWIANGALSAIERDGRNSIAVLSNGQRVPVSRAHVGAARALLDAQASAEE